MLKHNFDVNNEILALELAIANGKRGESF